jgi:protoporphyrinogen/coproporphyrinogen III oxidase
MSELDALVVGGGISGLAVAHALARSGLAVEVWEGEDRIGGKIRTEAKQGYRLERAASMVMNFRSELDPFLRGAGLEERKLARAPGAARYMVDAGRLIEVPSAAGELLRTPILSAAGKLRLLAEPLAPRAGNPDESVAEFVTRRLGGEFLEKLFEPYVAGPLASDADLAEARATLPRLTALERRYGSLALGALLRKVWRPAGGARPEAFSFAGGMATLVESLARRGGFRVRSRLRAREVRRARGGWVTTGDSERSAAFSRHLILSTPADAAASLVEGADAELARLLRGIEYAPVNVVHAGFDRGRIGHALKGSGFLLPRRSGFAPNGCLWMSSLFPGCAPEGRVLLSTYLGGARNPAAANWDDRRSLDAVMQMLNALLGIKVEPEMFHIDRHTNALPLYHGAYTRRLAAMDRRLAGLPGLHLEANYKGGISVRDRILGAELVAARILRADQAKSTRSFLAHAASEVHDMAPAPAAIR